MDTYSPAMIEKIKLIAERFNATPAEAFLAIIHVMHLVTRALRECEYHLHGEDDRFAEEKYYGKAEIAAKTMEYAGQAQSSISPESYLRAVGVLLPLIEMMSGGDLGSLGDDMLRQLGLSRDDLTQSGPSV